jgi:hypothetical protein
MHQPVMLHEGSIHQFVMLSEAKHPRNGSSHALGMTKKSVRNDIFGLVMLNEVKHPPICHAERSEASMCWIPHMRSE